MWCWNRAWCHFFKVARVNGNGCGCTLDMVGVSAPTDGVSAQYVGVSTTSARIYSYFILCHAGAVSIYPTSCSFLHSVVFIPSVHLVSWFLWVILTMCSNNVGLTDFQ